MPGSTEPDDSLAKCEPDVLENGAFRTGKPPDTTIEPGTSRPAAAVPGSVVYVESSGSGPLEPCEVPPEYQSSATSDPMPSSGQPSGEHPSTTPPQ